MTRCRPRNCVLSSKGGCVKTLPHPLPLVDRGETILFQGLHQLRTRYPDQFWLLFVGNLVSTIGLSMIWPFMMIYASERLRLPLTAVAGLLTVNSAFTLVGTFVAGTLADRVGRRGVMIVGMALHGTVYVFFSYAQALWMFALLMALSGLVAPIYRVGVDAMVADLIPPLKRVDAYAVLRTGNKPGWPSVPASAASWPPIPTAPSLVRRRRPSPLQPLTLLFLKETIPPRSEAGGRARSGWAGTRGSSRPYLRRPLLRFHHRHIGGSLCSCCWAVRQDPVRLPESRFGLNHGHQRHPGGRLPVMVTRVSGASGPIGCCHWEPCFLRGGGKRGPGGSFLAFWPACGPYLRRAAAGAYTSPWWPTCRAGHARRYMSILACPGASPPGSARSLAVS